MKILFLIVLFVILSACKSTRIGSNSYQSEPALNDLAVYAISLEGIPYKYGGNTPETGFDCSGFVVHVFKQTLGKSLPRTTYDMSRVGVEKDSDELMPGDLVFFNTMSQDNSHVGIYLGEGRFIHSPSTGKSISIANINATYWQKRYNGARRIKP